MFRGLLFYKAKGMSNDTSTLFLCLELKTLNEQLLEPALNLTVHCCGLEFRVLNGYDQKSFDEERGLNCVVQTSFDEERGSWRKRTKEDTRSHRSTKEDELRLCDIFVVLQGATPICEGLCRLTSLVRQEVWNDCRSCKVRVCSNGNLWWEAYVLLGRKKGCIMDTLKFTGMPFWVNQCTNGFHGVNELGGVRVAREDDHGVTGGREDVREVFQLRVRTSIWRDVRTLAIEEAYTTKYSIHPRADTMLCGFRLTNRWLSMKKDIASCGSKYLAYLEVEVEYQGSSRLLLQPELPE
ncbi:hypothetical protein Tco_0336767 [Tanacetum coccineum]